MWSSPTSQTGLASSWWDPLGALVGGLSRRWKAPALSMRRWGGEGRERPGGGVPLSPPKIQLARGTCKLQQACSQTVVHGTTNSGASCQRDWEHSGWLQCLSMPHPGSGAGCQLTPPLQRFVSYLTRGEGGESWLCKRQGGTMHPWVAGAKNRKPIKWQLWKANLKMRCNYNESEHKLLYFCFVKCSENISSALTERWAFSAWDISLIYTHSYCVYFPVNLKIKVSRCERQIGAI